jgi:4-hydroxy-2-oxoheptanedioate aldolase
MDFNYYLKESNRQKFLALQIEDPEVLPDIEAIAALDGVDMLFFGPGDFSQGLGAPGEWNHPRLIEARKLVAEVANKYGKFAATTGSIDNLESFLEMGYTFVNVGADIIGLNNYCTNLVERFRKSALGTKTPNSIDSGKPYR